MTGRCTNQERYIAISYSMSKGSSVNWPLIQNKHYKTVRVTVQ
jgi:hypothetical protein